MPKYIVLVFLFFSFITMSLGQSSLDDKSVKRQGIVWSAGLFKSWLKDSSVGFNKIGDKVTPVFKEQKKIGFSIQSHYMFKPTYWLGVGAHLGLGLDVNSNIKAPVVLFGASLSLGNEHQFIIDIGWADGKRKVVPNSVKDELREENYTEIPEIFNYSELNTGLYFGVGYKIF